MHQDTLVQIPLTKKRQNRLLGLHQLLVGAPSLAAVTVGRNWVYTFTIYLQVSPICIQERQ